MEGNISSASAEMSEESAAAKGKGGGRKLRRTRREKFLAYLKRNYILYLMTLPAVALLLLFNYYPMAGLQLAFKDWNPWEGIWGSPWASDAQGHLDVFAHFKTLMGNDLFWVKFGNTLRISTLKIVTGFPVPIIFVLLMNEMSWASFKKLAQTISYLPHFISWVIIAGILMSMTQTDSSLQLMLERLVGHQVLFFADNTSFLALVLLSDIWKNAGWEMIIYLAALATISPELYEAAEVDGAGRWSRMRFITLPGIMPAICIRLIFTVSGIASAGFDQIFNMYNSTVYDVGDILETYLYRTGIVGGQYDLSAAMGLFNSVIGLVLTLSANWIVKRAGGEGIW